MKIEIIKFDLCNHQRILEVKLVCNFYDVYCSQTVTVLDVNWFMRNNRCKKKKNYRWDELDSFCFACKILCNLERVFASNNKAIEEISSNLFQEIAGRFSCTSQLISIHFGNPSEHI